MNNHSSRFSSDTVVPGFKLHRVYSCRNGDIASAEILLPEGPATDAYVESLRYKAESDQELFRQDNDDQRTNASAKTEDFFKLFEQDPHETPDKPDPSEIPTESLTPVVTEPALLQVPCVHHQDVIDQQKSAQSNSKFSERDRTNAVKALTKSLIARPMTRAIGIPSDVDGAMQKLSCLAPHIPQLVETLRIPLLVAKATGAPPMIPPILLVGGPGMGKSHVALQIAQILGVPSHSLSYAASGAAGNVLSGSDKHWGNSSTGMVFEALSDGEFANPVILLDEIDKAGNVHTMSGQTRHPLNELLALLEPVTAREHRDKCAEIRVDASHIVWVATANSLTGLSAPLLSRFKLIMVDKPDARASVMITLSVARAVSEQMGVAVRPPSGGVLQLLATLTPRTVRRIWTGAAGWTTAAGRDTVTMVDLEHSLGLAPAHVTHLH